MDYLLRYNYVQAIRSFFFPYAIISLSVPWQA